MTRDMPKAIGQRRRVGFLTAALVLPARRWAVRPGLPEPPKVPSWCAVHRFNRLLVSLANEPPNLVNLGPACPQGCMFPAALLHVCRYVACGSSAILHPPRAVCGGHAQLRGGMLSELIVDFQLRKVQSKGGGGGVEMGVLQGPWFGSSSWRGFSW